MKILALLSACAWFSVCSTSAAVINFAAGGVFMAMMRAWR